MDTMTPLGQPDAPKRIADKNARMFARSTPD
jgi:hypothetical protein